MSKQLKKTEKTESQNKLIVFQGKNVRRAWYNNEWYYSLVDVISVLTDSANPTDYLKKLRKRDAELGFYIGTNCPQVEMETFTGKKRKNLPEMPGKKQKKNLTEALFPKRIFLATKSRNK